MAQQVQSPVLGVRMYLSKTHSDPESIHLPPVCSLTQLEETSLQHSRHCSAGTRWEGGTIRKWQTATQNKLNYFLLSGQPFLALPCCVTFTDKMTEQKLSDK